MNRNPSDFHGVQISVPLSKLIPNKRNPRRVKPERDAHRQKVASIRAFGLIQPLVVRADDKAAGGYRVIVGNGRLAALSRLARRPTFRTGSMRCPMLRRSTTNRPPPSSKSWRTRG